jgi:hypothetical protein
VISFAQIDGLDVKSEVVDGVAEPIDELLIRGDRSLLGPMRDGILSAQTRSSAEWRNT